MSVTVSTAALSSPYGWMGAQNLCCQIYASGEAGGEASGDEDSEADKTTETTPEDKPEK